MRTELKQRIKNHNTLTDTLAQLGYKTYYNGKDNIAYKINDNGFVYDEMTIQKDNNDKYFCYTEKQNGNMWQYHFIYDRHENHIEMKSKQTLADLLGIIQQQEIFLW